MRFVTSGDIQRLFLSKDPNTILRRPNIRRFALQYNVPCEIHQKAWLIDLDAFLQAIIIKEYPPQIGYIKIRTFENALKEYNSSHKRKATISDVDYCIHSGKVYAYCYWDRAILDYFELEKALDELLCNKDKK